MQAYSAAEVYLVLEWVDKYFEANNLIYNMLSGENLENPPPMPSLENEIEYQRLRIWFLKHHDKFVPIWLDFCLSHGYSIEYVDNTNEMEYRKNPFLYYYVPDNLLDLAYTMGATITADIWVPIRQGAELVLNIINSFSCTVIHLAWWIGEFADTGVQSP